MSDETTILWLTTDQITKYQNGRFGEYTEADLIDLLDGDMSIEKMGQLQPVLVSVDINPGKYRLEFGFRRFEAICRINARRLTDGLEPLKIKCELDNSGKDESERFEMNVAENYARKPLTHMDMYICIKTLTGYGRKSKEIAKLLRVTETVISQHKKLSQLSAQEAMLLHTGKLPFTAVTALLDFSTKSKDRMPIIEKCTDPESGTISADSVQREIRKILEAKADAAEDAKKNLEDTDNVSIDGVVGDDSDDMGETSLIKPKLKDIKKYLQEQSQAADNPPVIQAMFAQIYAWTNGEITERTANNAIGEVCDLLTEE